MGSGPNIILMVPDIFFYKLVVIVNGRQNYFAEIHEACRRQRLDIIKELQPYDTHNNYHEIINTALISNYQDIVTFLVPKCEYTNLLN